MQILKRPNQKMHDNAPLVEPMITDTSQSNEVFRDIIFPTDYCACIIEGGPM